MKHRTAFVLASALVLSALGLSQRDEPNSLGGQAKIAFVRSGFVSLKASLEAFRRDCGRFPTTQEGLSALESRPAALGSRWIGPYVGGPTKDAWARAYWYVATESGFALASFGADGKPGGVGMDEDLAVTSQG